VIRDWIFANGAWRSRLFQMRSPHAETGGFTLLELLVATFVIGVAVAGLFGLILLTVRTASEGERRIAATALANEKMELVRNLPYSQVGTAGGVPNGPLPQIETTVRNGTSYTVRTDIRYVDDPYDGVTGGSGGSCTEISHYPPGNPGNCQDLCVNGSGLNAHLAHGDSLSEHCDGSPISGVDMAGSDYKQVRVEVSWASQQAPKPVLVLTYVVPDGIEGAEDGGTLDFQALDAAGAGVQAAQVRLVNAAVDPPIDLITQTNAEGRVVLPGLPPANGSYVLSVGREDYTSEQTYDTTVDFVPDADHVHLSIFQGEVNKKTFFIDADSSLALTFEEGGSAAEETECQPGHAPGAEYPPLPGIAYTLHGTKTIGTDGEGEAVFAVSAAGTSDSNGEAVHEDLVWDQYALFIDAAAECDIAEASQPLPLSLAPGEAAVLTLRLVAHTPVSLHVSIVTAADGEPVDNATVHLIGTDFDEESVTGEWGQVFFADLPGVGEYGLEVTAPGFASFSDTIAVEGTAQMTVELGAE